jgi:hypothetical protein
VCVGSYCAMVGFNCKGCIVTAGGGYSLRRFGFNDTTCVDLCVWVSTMRWMVSMVRNAV